jgi:hypothetical protein
MSLAGQSFIRRLRIAVKRTEWATSSINKKEEKPICAALLDLFQGWAKDDA